MAVRRDEGLELEVTDPQEQEGQGKASEGEGKRELELRVQSGDDGGRQENSLGTVRYNSEVLYTNTGWSVRS